MANENKLKKFESDDPKTVFDFIFKNFFLAFAPMQKRKEFVELLKIFKEKKPKTILEIGTAKGGTLFCFCKLALQDATIISIDLPEGPFGGGYPEWKRPIYKSFSKTDQKLHLLRKDSHKEETLEEVRKILGDNKLDFLFIDGTHAYEGVKKDFEMYGPLVKEEGIIAFHDIVKTPEVNGNVPRLWKEIKAGKKYEEFVKNWDQSGYGIGVIYK
ncbi:MAG: class I SAM-dependent methyltransferase [bacterium]